MRRLLLPGAATLAAGLLLWTAAAEPPKERPDGDDLPVTGKADPDLASFDRLMTDFVTKYHLPGAALAVARDGRLVYARGFGYADRDKKEPVEPNALFRIASVTKPLTSAAILQLVERGQLALDDKVFDVLELKAPRAPRSSSTSAGKKSPFCISCSTAAAGTATSRSIRCSARPQSATS